MIFSSHHFLRRTLLATAVLPLTLALPAHAGLFDVLDTLTKKVKEGDAAAQLQLDVEYEQELRKARPAHAFGAPAAEQASRYFEIDRGSSAKELKKIAVLNFTVEFVRERESTALGGDRSNRVRLAIPAEDTARMQAIVDELYGKTLTDLQALGLEVMPPDQIQATKSYREVAESLKLSLSEAEVPGDVEGGSTANSSAKSIFVAPANVRIYPDNAKRPPPVASGGGLFGTNFPMKTVTMLYDLNREVELLSVNLVVDFSAMRSSGRSLLNVAKVRAANLHHLQAGNSYFAFRSSRNLAPSFTFKQPLVSDKPILSPAKVREGATEVKDKMTGTEVTVKFDGNEFDAETYYGRSAEMLEAARQMFIAELRRLRS
ncbi:MAG: hypothetical protein RIQ60_593 [Pseudomonadota bacterium]